MKFSKSVVVNRLQTLIGLWFLNYQKAGRHLSKGRSFYFVSSKVAPLHRRGGYRKPCLSNLLPDGLSILALALQTWEVLKSLVMMQECRSPGLSCRVWGWQMLQVCWVPDLLQNRKCKIYPITHASKEEKMKVYINFLYWLWIEILCQLYFIYLLTKKLWWLVFSLSGGLLALCSHRPWVQSLAPYTQTDG